MFFKLPALTLLCMTVIFLGSCSKKNSISEVNTPKAITPKVTEQSYHISRNEYLILGDCINGQQNKCEQAKKIDNEITNWCNKGNRVACTDLKFFKELALKGRLYRSRLDSTRGAFVAVQNCKNGIEQSCVQMREIESNLIKWCSETGDLKKEWCKLLDSVEAMQVSEPVR
jgi:hypothetical protein